MEQIIVPKDMIGPLIGPGGKVIQQIQADSGTIITIEEKNEKGYVTITADNKEGIDKALVLVNGIVEEPEVGTVYKGKVKSVVSFGAFVEILPGKEGLLHISEIDWKRIGAVEDVLKEGDIVEVKMIDIDKRTGKLKLSRKALLPRPPREESKKPRERS